MPTETVYGLAADAQNAEAVTLVFSAKDRPAFDPLIVHVAHGDPEVMVRGVVDLLLLDSDRRERFVHLARFFWPGPLTFVLPKEASVPDLVTSGLATVGVRMPDHPVTQALLAAFGGPLVAPSANRFGRISPTTAEHVISELDGRIPAVLDGGPCRIGVESTIVAIGDSGRVRMLRPGGISREALEKVIGPLEVRRGRGIEAPGQTPHHYAPATASVLLPSSLEDLSDGDWRRLADGRRVGVLRVLGPVDGLEEQLVELGIAVGAVRTLSRSADLGEAARELFATLRELDEGPSERLLIEPVPTTQGLGHAIADRLRRATVEAGR
jgi:L-threonylcarbamoyladenylate synthase